MNQKEWWEPDIEHYFENYNAEYPYTDLKAIIKSITGIHDKSARAEVINEIKDLLNNTKTYSNGNEQEYVGGRMENMECYSYSDIWKIINNL